jgi:DNA repair exonuclease SbcCD ATPase subunit
LDKWGGAQWINLQTDKMTNTREMVLEALGVTYSRFLSMAYMSPRVASKFLRGSNSERIDIMAGVTGVEEWDVVYKNAKERRLAIQKAVSDTQSRIAYTEGSLSQAKSHYDAAQKEDFQSFIDKYQQDLIQYQAQIKEFSDAENDLKAELEGLHKAQYEAYSVSGTGTISQEISDLAVEEGNLRNPSFIDKSLPEFDPALGQKAVDAQSKYQMAVGALSAVKASANLSQVNNCPTCGQTITESHKNLIRSAIDEKATLVEDAKKQWAEAAATAEASLKSIADARSLRYRERLARADGLATSIRDLKLKLQSSNLEYERITGVISQKSQEKLVCAQEIMSIGHSINHANAQIVDLRSRMSKVAILHESVKRLEAELVDLQGSISGDLTDLSILEWLVRNIPYIKLHRISVALIQLSEKVNSYLSEMGETIRVNLSSFEEKKSLKGAEDVKDTLKSEIRVEVIDGLKNIDPRLYSDGETAKISNALIRGLHDISLQSGYGCNILLLDEIFSYVDPANAQKVADSFQRLSAGSIFVTDNSGYVNDLVRFNERWVVRKRNGMSVLEV